MAPHRLHAARQARDRSESDRMPAERAPAGPRTAAVPARAAGADVAALAAGPSPVRQPLVVGAADAPAEAAADAVASRVVRRLAASADPVAGPAVPGGRSALPTTVRRTMESAMGADLSGVRVHTGPAVRDLNERLEAKAFTAGRDVFFRDGFPDVRRPEGQGLLAHELAHVVQGGAGHHDIARFALTKDSESVWLTESKAGKKKRSTELAKVDSAVKDYISRRKAVAAERLTALEGILSAIIAWRMTKKGKSRRLSQLDDLARQVYAEVTEVKKLRTVGTGEGAKDRELRSAGGREFIKVGTTRDGKWLVRFVASDETSLTAQEGDKGVYDPDTRTILNRAWTPADRMHEYGAVTTGEVDDGMIGRVKASEKKDWDKILGTMDETHAWNAKQPTATKPFDPVKLKGMESTGAGGGREVENLRDDSTKGGTDRTSTRVGTAVIEGYANDRFYDEKVDVVTKAMDRLVKMGFPMPKNLAIVMPKYKIQYEVQVGGDTVTDTVTSGTHSDINPKSGGPFKVQNRGFGMKEDGDTETSYGMTLTSGIFDSGGPVGVADEFHKHLLAKHQDLLGTEAQDKAGAGRAEAVVIHEFGHLLHSYLAEEQAFLLKKIDNDSDNANTDRKKPPSEKVSPYAMDSQQEFVAEVFTGIVMFDDWLTRYDKDVMKAYVAFGGMLTPDLEEALEDQYPDFASW